ncbi:MAG TPA: ATP-binding protein [Rhizomicrobium sp.]|nr:ATP-binding protein [Rhizomicrobium sp.]
MPKAMMDRMSSPETPSTERLLALVTAVEWLSAADGMDGVIRVVRETARTISGADGVTFVLRDGDQCHYVDEDAVGPLWKGRRFPLTACISGWCMLNDQMAVIPDIYADPRVPHDAYRPTFVKSLVMVPVRAKTPIAAIGSYWSKVREFSENEIVSLEALARSTAAAISAIQARERIARLQSEIAHIGRLNEMGQMVSAFAHELNQPLTAANNYLRAAKRFYETGMQERVPELIGKADDQFTRVSQIIKRIRSFASKTETVETVEAIAPLIAEAAELALLDPHHRGIDVRIDIPGDLPPARVDKVQIQQVLLNLFRNAFEALEASDVRRVTVSAQSGSNMVEISVADTGPGLAPDVAAKLFQPFVTTKEGGMGVGLSICRTIVESHGGRMWIAPGSGADFHFTVPIAERTAH